MGFVGRALLCVALLPPMLAEAEPDAVFCNGMTLPSGRSVAIWGKCRPGANVEVRFFRANYRTKADADGEWLVATEVLPELPQGEDLGIREDRKPEKVFTCVKAGPDADAKVLARSTMPVVFTPGLTDVAISPEAGFAVRLAAREMTNFLSRVFGREVPLVTRIVHGRRTIVLGGDVPEEGLSYSQFRCSAQCDKAKLPEGAFAVLTWPDRVIIEGADDPRREPVVGGINPDIRHGTLNGVYAFLEDICGCRFYFPGDLGTVVPCRDRIEVPATDRVFAPNMGYRLVSMGGEVPQKVIDACGSADEVRRMQAYRLRLSTQGGMPSHGQENQRFHKRFHASHPEYFALQGHDKDGKEKRAFLGLCQSSDAWEAFYSLALQKAKGVRSPDWPLLDENGVNVMPVDGMKACCCEACRKAFREGDANFASELVWRRTAEFATRLKRDAPESRMLVWGMAYHPYQSVPSVTLPDNVRIFLAVSGPWTASNVACDRFHTSLIDGWYVKLGDRRNALWTYPGKYGGFNVKGLPDFTPRAFGAYFKRHAAHIDGAFCNGLTDRWMFEVLNNYVFAKVAWDPAVDVDALISEHAHLLYGAAATPMLRAYDVLEREWLLFATYDFDEKSTGYGPRGERSALGKTVWAEESRKEVSALFDAAAAAVPSDSIERRRVDFMRSELFKPVLDMFSEREAKDRWDAQRRKNRAAIARQPLSWRISVPKARAGELVTSLVDGVAPFKSSDSVATKPFVSNPYLGRGEEIEIVLSATEKKTFTGVEVMFSTQDGTPLPRSWMAYEPLVAANDGVSLDGEGPDLDALVGGEAIPAKTAYPVAPDRFCRADFARPVTGSSIRLVFTVVRGKKLGIHEIRPILVK